jgi:glucosamine-6-phosphate deaminase
MMIHSYHDASEMSQQLAKKVYSDLASGKVKNLALPTGRTPILFYQSLTKLIKENKLSLQSIHTFNLDEFLFKDNDQIKSLSYKNYMQEHFFSKLSIPSENIHFPLENQDYDALIEKMGGIDLALIGIGNNGHIAFNEPGSQIDSPTRVIELKKESREQNAKLFNQKLEQIPTHAITMGLKTLLASRKVYLLASGIEKKEILKKSFSQTITSEIPASYLQKHPRLELFLDQNSCWT